MLAARDAGASFNSVRAATTSAWRAALAHMASDFESAWLAAAAVIGMSDANVTTTHVTHLMARSHAATEIQPSYCDSHSGSGCDRKLARSPGARTTNRPEARAAC